MPGPLDYHDYSAAAIGMTYKNNNNTGGLTIDGQPETAATGAVTWESVDGPQGGLSIAHSVDSDIPGLTVGTYYLDDSTPGGGRRSAPATPSRSERAGPTCWATCPTPTRARARSTG